MRVELCISERSFGFHIRGQSVDKLRNYISWNKDTAVWIYIASLISGGPKLSSETSLMKN